MNENQQEKFSFDLSETQMGQLFSHKGKWKTTVVDGLHLWPVTMENAVVFDVPRIIGLGPFQKIELNEQQLEEIGHKGYPFFIEGSGHKANIELDYPVIELKTSESEYLSSVSNKNKKRREVLKSLRMLDENEAFVRQLDTEEGLKAVNMFTERGFWSKHLSVKTDNYEQVICKLLTLKPDLQYSVWCYSAHGFDRAWFITIETENTLYSLCQVKAQELSTRQSTLALIRAAREKGFTMLDIDNLVNSDATSYKSLFFNGGCKIGAYANNKYKMYIENNKHDFPWVHITK